MKQKIKKTLTRLTVITLGLVFAVSFSAPPVSAAVTNQSLAVPMYEYPTIGTYWDDITGAGASALPFVIVNPGSGPGASVDPIYTAEIAENTSDGIRSIGYVYTSYQTRNWQDVYDDIDDWYTMYPGISGIFIDLVADNVGDDLCYMAGLYNHVKNEHPNDLVILNPGTYISMNYEPYGDIFMNAENTYAVYQANWTPQFPGWDDNPLYQNRFWHSIHTLDSSDYTAALNLTRNNNAGFVYLTDDVMPNPYRVTPTYWNTEISDVTSLPASTIPNRGKTQLPSGCRDLTATATDSTIPGATQTTTASNITVANTSADYAAEPTTKIAFSMPSGVTLNAGTGTNWTCNTTTGECSYGASIAASGSAAVLGASFVADCDYTSGNITGTVSNFAGNTSTVTVTPERPNDCAVAGALANAGVSAGIGTVAGCAIIGAAGYVYFVKPRVRYQYVTFKRRKR
jgi:hypothetical protein